MVWKYTDFHREKLYEQVWAEPVTKVAKYYSISDVGLRKICRNLDVPLPPVGYWAKSAAGKTVKKPCLEPTDGPTSYRRSQYVDEELAAECDVRLKQDLPHHGTTPSVPLRTSVDDCLPLAKRVAKRLQGKGKNARDWCTCDCPGLMPVSTSRDSSLRAVLLLNLVLESVVAAGYVLSSDAEGDTRAAFVSILQLKLSFRVRERDRREMLPLTPEQQRKNHEVGFNYYPPRYVQYPTGKFDIAATELGGSYQLARIGDTEVSSVEARVPAFIDRLRELAIRHQVQDELAEKRRGIAAARAEEARRQAEARRLALARLKDAEDWAAQLERANRLRNLADIFESKHLLSSDGVVNAVWLRRAADWLDPTVEAAWDEVDGQPDDDAPDGVA